MKQRLNWADRIRGILIVLVVLGHAIQYTPGVDCFRNHLWNYIYSFHMAAFIAISGWLGYHGDSHEKGGGYEWRVLWRRT